MKQKFDMFTTAEQSRAFRDMGVIQGLTPFVWGKAGENDCLFTRNMEDEKLICITNVPQQDLENVTDLADAYSEDAMAAAFADLYSVEIQRDGILSPKTLCCEPFRKKVQVEADFLLSSMAAADIPVNDFSYVLSEMYEKEL